MAKSGIIKTNTTYDSYFFVKWEIQSQSKTDNKSKIKWSCGCYTGHNFYLNAIWMSSVTINGKKVYDGGTYSNFNRLETHTIASGTLDIAHNSDGNKTFKISAFKGWLYENNNYSAAESSYTLDKIDRLATTTSATDFTDESNPTIQFTNPANFTIYPYINIYDENNNAVYQLYRSTASITSPYTWNITSSEREAIRNACNTQSEYKATIGVDTFSGSTKLGYNSLAKTFKIVNANPQFSISQVSYKDTNTASVNVTGNNQKIVQSRSNFKTNFTAATPKKGASISKYVVSLGDTVKETTATGTDIDLGKVTQSGKLKLKVKVIDSRGLSTEVSKDIDVIEWAYPKAEYSVQRVNNYESTTKIKVDVDYSSVENLNGITIWYKMKKTTDTSYGSAVYINNNEEVTVTCDNNYSWDFAIGVYDSFRTSPGEKHIVIGRGVFPLFIDTENNAVGINGFPDKNEAFRVAGGKARFDDGAMIGTELIADFVIEQGSDGIWTYQKWNSGKAECWGTWTGTLTHYKTTNGFYAYYSSISFPSNLFNAIPVPTYSAGVGSVFALPGNLGTLTKEKMNCYALASSGGSQSVKFCIQVFGTWK